MTKIPINDKKNEEKEQVKMIWSKQYIMQDKSKQSNINKVKSSQSADGVNKQMGYRQVFVTFWLQDKTEQKYARWDWEVIYLIG